MLSSPAALWIPNAWFYEVGRGALSYCLSRTPISALIHYLWRIGTHRPRNTHSPPFYFFLLRHTNISELLTVLAAVSPARPQCQCGSWPPTSLSPPPHATALTRASLHCRSAGVMRLSEALVAVQSSWSRHGQRSLEWHRQARPHRLHQPYPPSPQPPLAAQQVRPVCLFFDKNSQPGNVIGSSHV